MSIRRLLLACCALAPALLGGCSPARGPALSLEIEAVRPLAPDRFAAGRQLLSGPIYSLSGENWRQGDSVLLGIALDAGGEQREWYLRATAVGKVHGEYEGHRFTLNDSVRVRRTGNEDGWLRIDFDLVAVSVELFDGEARLVSKTTAMMPELCLQFGLSEYIEQSLAGSDPFAASAAAVSENGEMIAGNDVRRAVAGWIAIMRIPDFLQRDRGMEQLLWRIIDRPGVLSMIANRGVQMEVGLSGQDATVVSHAIGEASAFRVPVSLTLNGRPAVRCEILVTRGDPPLGPCNGLLALDAVHPSDPARRLAVRLLAAHRGMAETPPGEN